MLDVHDKGLSKVQLTLLERRLDQLMKDCFLRGVICYLPGGGEVQKGEIPAPTPFPFPTPTPGQSRKPRIKKGGQWGEVAVALRPFLSAMEPGDSLTLRPDDFPGVEWSRIKGAVSAMGSRMWGPGWIKGTTKIEQGQESFYITRLKAPQSKTRLALVPLEARGDLP